MVTTLNIIIYISRVLKCYGLLLLYYFGKKLRNYYNFKKWIEDRHLVKGIEFMWA